MILTPLLAIQLLENNQSGRYLLVNAALYTLSGLIRVLSRSAGAVPSTPAEGDAYIVDTVADGWAGATLGDIALYYGSAWHFITPVEGMEIPIADEQSRAMWTGSLWHVTDYGTALAADPPDPPNNMRCTWQSDGTGLGNDGDIMMKITDSTGTTRTITVGGESGPTYYSVTYDDNESTSGSVPVDSNQYLSGDFANVLDNTGTLEKTGYEFSGWNTEPDGSGTDYYFEDTFEITGNVTLYAKWGVEYLSVTYDDNGSTNGPSYVPVDENGYLSGDTVTVLANIYSLYKTGYDFAGWNTASDGSGTDYAPSATFEITVNTVLYAKWTAV